VADKRTARQLVDSMIVGGSPATKAKIHGVLDRVPLEALRITADANTRIRTLRKGEQYRDASPALKRLGVDVDAWPAPPAGLFVVEERTLYLRSVSDMTIAHEFGHAVDCALGDGIYKSSIDPDMRAEFDKAPGFVTPYAQTGKDEWFAEGFRSFLNANDEHSHWPKVSPERLKRFAPKLFSFFEQTFGEKEITVDRELAAAATEHEQAAVAAARLELEQNLAAGGDVGARAPSSNEKRNEHYRELTKDLIAVLESGSAKNVSDQLWRVTRNGIPFNPTTEQAYRGGNVLRLLVTSVKRGWSDPRFMTVKQANKKGWSVRAGERGTYIEVWKFKDRYRDESGNVLTGKALDDALADPKQKEKLDVERHGICRFYTVFNASQIDAKVEIDGETVKKPLIEVEPLIKEQRGWDLHERAEFIAEALGVPIRHDGGNEAYYLPSRDDIHLPLREAFPSADNYYDTLMHEAGHATGHESRLNRPMLKNYSKDVKERAREELRAELTSFFMAAELGLPHNIERHADYIGSWAQLLRDNHMEIFDASKDAQAAHDFLLARERELLKQREQEQTQERSESPELALVSALAVDGERAPVLQAFDRFEASVNRALGADEERRADVARKLATIRRDLYVLVDHGGTESKYDVSRFRDYARIGLHEISGSEKDPNVRNAGETLYHALDEHCDALAVVREPVLPAAWTIYNSLRGESPLTALEAFREVENAVTQACDNDNARTVAQMRLGTIRDMLYSLQYDARALDPERAAQYQHDIRGVLQRTIAGEGVAYAPEIHEKGVVFLQRLEAMVAGRGVAREQAVDGRAAQAAFSPLVEDRFEHFVEKLREAGHDRNKAWSVCMNEIKALKAAYDITTVRRMLTTLRAAVRDMDPQHPAIEFLRASTADTREVNAATRANIMERLKGLRAIDPEHVADAAELLLRSNNFPNLVAGVILATGRRLPEVAHGRFTPIGETYLDFSGAVKGSTKDLTIPSLVEAGLVVDAIAQLREMKPVADMDVKALNGSYSKTVAAAMRRALGPDYQDVSLEDARALYATVAHEWHGSATTSLVAYHAEILGHNPDVVTSALGKIKFFPVGKELETCERLEHARLELISRVSHRLNNPDLSPNARASLQQDLQALRAVTFDVRQPAQAVERPQGVSALQVGQSRDGAGASDRSAPSLAPSLQNEDKSMPANRGILIGYPGKPNLRENERGQLLKVGLKQTFGRGDDRKEKWYDVSARDDVAAKLNAALQDLKKGQMLKVEVGLERSSYKGRDEHWHDTVELPVQSFEIVDKLEKGQKINNFEISGKVLDEPKLEPLPSGDVATNVRLEVPGLKRGKEDQLRVRLFGDEARKFVSEVKQGQQLPVTGRLQISQYEDKDKAVQKRPELVLTSYGADLAQSRENEPQRAPEQAQSAAPASGIDKVAVQKQPYRVIPEQNLIVEFARENGEIVASHEVTIVKRENLPYNLTGRIVAESLDGQKIYQELGKTDVLELDKAAFEGRLPDVGDRVELRRGDDGKETAIFKDEQRAQNREREQSRDRDRDDGRELAAS
jgi:antirestriction protein ArdC/single-stranded DNA-binding protein